MRIQRGLGAPAAPPRAGLRSDPGWETTLGAWQGGKSHRGSLTPPCEGFPKGLTQEFQGKREKGMLELG